MKVLYLHLKKKWFDMFASGEKLEEYRDDTPYWQKRLIDKSGNLKQYDYVIFLSGYPKKGCENRILSFAYPQIRMGKGNPEWGAIHGKTYFVITPGAMLHRDEAICEGCKRIYNEKKNYGICPYCHYDNILVKNKRSIEMKNQQKFRIVADLYGMFTVEELQNCCWIKRFIAGKGKAGLELAEEWLANRKD